MLKGVIHKGCPHKFGSFWDPPPPPSPCPGLSTFDWPPHSPCTCGHKFGIIWNIATCEQFTLKGKKLISLYENNVKNIRMKTIFKMMSLHCVPYILYWIRAEWKFYIQTYWRSSHWEVFCKKGVLFYQLMLTFK